MREIFIDFDGVIGNCIKAVCDLYNEDYAGLTKPAIWHEVAAWDFSDQCPLISKKTLYSYFDNHRLFDKMEFMDNSKEVVERLSDKFQIIIVTKGTDKNFKLKQKWLHENLECSYEFIGVPTYVKYKTNIDMTGGIFIDDRVDNLNHSNAEIKIAFGDIYEWNCRWEGNRCFNWYDIERVLNSL